MPNPSHAPQDNKPSRPYKNFPKVVFAGVVAAALYVAFNNGSQGSEERVGQDTQDLIRQAFQQMDEANLFLDDFRRAAQRGVVARKDCDVVPSIKTLSDILGDGIIDASARLHDIGEMSLHIRQDNSTRVEIIRNEISRKVADIKDVCGIQTALLYQ
jgi:hypothetical protein